MRVQLGVFLFLSKGVKMGTCPLEFSPKDWYTMFPHIFNGNEIGARQSESIVIVIRCVQASIVRNKIIRLGSHPDAAREAHGAPGILAGFKRATSEQDEGRTRTDARKWRRNREKTIGDKKV